MSDEKLTVVDWDGGGPGLADTMELTPDEALKALRDLLREDRCVGGDAWYSVLQMARCHFKSLDGWIQRGGALPEDWQHEKASD